MNDLPTGLSRDAAPTDESVSALRSEIAQSLPDALLLVDDQARVRWANDAAADLFGIPVEEAIERGLTGSTSCTPTTCSSLWCRCPACSRRTSAVW